MTDLIEILPNALDVNTCNALIDVFEHSEQAGQSPILSSQGSTNMDREVRRSSGLILSPDNSGQHYARLNEAYQKAYAAYVQKYPVLRAVKQILSEAFTLVRYDNSSEHYGWHVDGADPGSRYRYLSGVCYLNTVSKGGETEFRVQQRKVKPEQGSIVMFPSGWPWEHRGNPPESGKKYIITTWLRFADIPPL